MCGTRLATAEERLFPAHLPMPAVALVLLAWKALIVKALTALNESKPCEPMEIVLKDAARQLASRMLAYAHRVQRQASLALAASKPGPDLEKESKKLLPIATLSEEGLKWTSEFSGLLHSLRLAGYRKAGLPPDVEA